MKYQRSAWLKFTLNEKSSFQEYILSVKSMLSQIHIQPDVIDPQKIIDGNSPFELLPKGSFQTGKAKPYQRGVLLVHGLTDSPYFMRHLAAFFQQKGFRVMAILLPGHGTQPSDLLDVTWQAWAATVAFGVDKLDEEVDELYLAGFSAGGALSILQSLQDARVRGLFLFSPALKILRRAAFAHWHKAYSWLYPSAQWVYLQPDTDLYKYESLTKNAVAQMYALTQCLKAKLAVNKQTIPIFAAVSAEDVTVDSAATVKYMENSSNSVNRLVYYTAKMILPMADFPNFNLELVDSTFPKDKILSSAHTAVVLPPEDEYYGRGGTYANCLHYFPQEPEHYHICMTRPEQVFQGEITTDNLHLGVMRRLMYNPNFELMTQSMGKFIDELTRV